jgi:hypothetical protein
MTRSLKITIFSIAIAAILAVIVVFVARYHGSNDGGATLQGVDSDGDGVRDDVQHWIAVSYPNSAKARAWLTQVALADEAALNTGGLSSQSAQASFDKLNGALACGWFIYGADEKSMSDALLMQILDTKDRVKAYARFTSQLTGQVSNVITDSAQRKAACAFDPTTQPN